MSKMLFMLPIMLLMFSEACPLESTMFNCLSNESLTLLSNLQNPGAEPTSAMDVDNPAMDPDLEWETVPETLKDDNTFVHAVRDIVGSQWRRVTHLQENWGPIIKDLTLAYVTWKYPSESPPKDAVVPPSPSLSASPSSYDFEIECIDLYTLSNTTRIQRNANVKTVSEALVLNGYIGATPQSPSIAISLRTLELYRRIRLQKPLFSAEAFTKVLCDLYNISNVSVELQVLEALGHNSPNWRVLNACPPCLFELEGEPLLLYWHMIIFYGNNSLSQMAPLGGYKVGDMHMFDSENWKAAADEAKKKTWGIFKETGIFACTCRHGMMLWIVDMVRSSELFKYPLSIVNKALEVLGPQLLIGYDVGCKLTTTIKSTSLATKFNKSNSRLCVDAFHGYTHNYACQDKNHPNIIQGMGLEDFSTMEQIFSSSNQLAPWDEDKYMNIGNMLYNNYRQSLDIVERETIEFEHAKLSLGIMDENIEEWQKQQSVYLKTLGEEAEWDVHAMTYVEMLQNLRDAQSRICRQSVVNMQAGNPVMTCEWALHGGGSHQTKYNRALDELQCLVVLRLFKLHKLNLSQTGYHMRTHIAKALQTRCKAIQNKVKEYNAAASVLVPPAPSLDWSHVSHYDFLDEFTLLCETRQDSLHIKRAHEEVHHCNIELRRLHSSIATENSHFEATLQRLKAESSLLYHSIKEFAMRHMLNNSQNLTCVYQTFSLAGFMGDKTVGMKKSLSTILNPSLTHTDIFADQQNDEAESDMDEEDEACGVYQPPSLTISTKMVAFAVLGGRDPDPFIATGKTAPAFPLIVACESTKQAQHVMTLQPFINMLSQQVLQTNFVDALLQSDALKAIFPHRTPFYPVVYGRSVGIYLSWDAALQQVNGRQIRKFKKTRLFVEAVEFILTKGNEPMPTQPTLPPLYAPATPSRSKIHVSSRTMAGTVPALCRPKQSVTDAADALSTLSLDIGDAPQPSISQPTQPGPHTIYRYIRSLTGIVGEEYSPPDPSMRNSEDYKGSAVFHILLGFKEAYCPLDFVNIALEGEQGFPTTMVTDRETALSFSIALEGEKGEEDVTDGNVEGHDS
ncbi:hypothetical protein EV702DRAFT_1041995 [Suillus placidus]|uniref:Ribonuclease H1 N-terminal domain-containing protein n=1 Tax=Suillus placidus TaxID=48579 RepID=A0A9P7D7K6_9AGAM|nr:hypothetical protein EV702DRAFT_1041995 [Suillus placidus]